MDNHRIIMQIILWLKSIQHSHVHMYAEKLWARCTKPFATISAQETFVCVVCINLMHGVETAVLCTYVLNAY